jgi:hypothetical protein
MGESMITAVRLMKIDELLRAMMNSQRSYGALDSSKLGRVSQNHATC